jgi:PAS domain S-box-containing protein
MNMADSSLYFSFERAQSLIQLSFIEFILITSLAGISLVFIYLYLKTNRQNHLYLDQLSAIFHMNPMGLILADEEGLIVELNPSVSKLFGYTIEQLLGLHLSTLFSTEYFHDENSPLIDFLMHLKLHPGEAPIEIKGLNEAGTAQMLLVNFNQYLREEDLYYLFSIQDISQDIALKEKLNQSDARLDIRVEERTSELVHANGALKLEIENRKKAEKKRDQSIADLKVALDQIKILNGLIPICASCKKVRDDTGFWEQIEGYIKKNSEANFSHSICPDCHETLYPELR